MINDLDETIKHLLREHIPLDPGEVDVTFEVPDREWSSRISKPTLNCYLYDIRENRALRESDWIVERGEDNKTITRQRPPIRVDLSYLITAWTQSPEDEHTLLWHTMAVLLRFPVLPEAVLQGRLREQTLPVRTQAAQPDGVLKSPGEFWTALENQLKPSLGYVVTLAMDREKLVAGPPVFTWNFQVGKRTPYDPANARAVSLLDSLGRDEISVDVAGARERRSEHTENGSRES